MTKKKILITGGLGFVGGRLARYLGSEHEIYISSRKTPDDKTLKLHGEARFIPHNDLLHSETFPRSVDVVIHLAALNEIDCVSQPSEAISVNIDQSRIILENSVKQEAKRFIYFSTVHVYGSPLSGHIDEHTSTRPSHPYSITHRAAEDYVLAAFDRRQINALVIRLSNSFGAPVTPDVNRWTLLVNDLCRQAVTTRQLKLNSNGCQFRDFITLSDVEQAIKHLIHSSDINSDIINLVAGKSLTVLEMATLVASCYTELTGKEIPVLLPDNARPSKEPGLTFSTDRLNETGFMIKNDYRSEIKALISFCIKHFSDS